MNIQQITDKALKEGFLTLSMESEIGKICEDASKLSLEEYMVLERFMDALLEGEVVSMPRKQFINVMEELVLAETLARVAEIEPTTDNNLDIGDLAAYALNRLPPLYATTQPGADYQLIKARDELQPFISRAIRSAIARGSERPESIGEVIGQVGQGGEISQQISSLLQSHASNYEA